VSEDFWVVVEWRFCRGFCGKWSELCGFLLVNLWWIAGKSWCGDGLVFEANNLPLFENISVDFPFWESVGTLRLKEPVYFFGLWM
jgi:hypothetical protein